MAGIQTAMDVLAAAKSVTDTESVPKGDQLTLQQKAAEGKKWEDLRDAKREEIKASIPSEYVIPSDILPPADQRNVTNFVSESGFFTDKEIDITASTASRITREVVAKRWTAEEVTRAFCKSAAVAHQLTNCLTYAQFDKAIAQAKALDEEYVKTGKPKGPLHGVPVSLKDNVRVKGAASTVGFSAYATDYEPENGYFTDLLISLGAIIYVKTNVPTAMMMAETTNNLFGTTSNPLNRNLTPGGSSGGESSLISQHGSPLGCGTDIGGSLRIPAACTGLWTIRASGYRLPSSDFRPGLAGQETIPSVQGPLAHSLEDVQLYLKAVIDSQPWLHDPKVIPLAWRTVDIPKKLKIGVIWDDGYVRPTPPIARALKETVEKLKKAGHEVVEWDNRSIMRVYGLLARLFTVDGGKTISEQIAAGNEPWPTGIKSFGDAKEVGVYDLWQLQREKAAILKEWLDRYNDTGVDALLLPVAPYVAPKHGGFTHIGYTGLFNLLDYSAATFQTGIKGDKEKDVYTDEVEPFNPLDKATREAYSAEEIDGLPIGLQLIGRRLEEEKVLGMVKRVLEAL